MKDHLGLDVIVIVNHTHLVANWKVVALLHAFGFLKKCQLESNSSKIAQTA